MGHISSLCLHCKLSVGLGAGDSDFLTIYETIITRQRHSSNQGRHDAEIQALQGETGHAVPSTLGTDGQRFRHNLVLYLLLYLYVFKVKHTLYVTANRPMPHIILNCRLKSILPHN